MFRNNPEEYYLPNQCSSSDQVSNNISRGNEENLKRLRGLFVDFDYKRAQVKTGLDLGQNEHRDFRCKDCQEPFNNRMALKTHRIIKHIVQRVYECEQCRKMFAFKESLMIHKRTCGKECKTKPVVKMEKQAPSEIKVNFMFDFSAIQVKGSSSPDISQSSLTCSDCGGSFAKKALLIWHRRHVCKWWRDHPFKLSLLFIFCIFFVELKLRRWIIF